MVVVNMRSTPRVSLVTGGTDGIGRAVALQLAVGGDRVLFVGRDAERGAEVLSALRAARPGVQHVFLQADLSLLSEAARVADEVEQLTDRLDAGVFCAGVLALRPEWTREGLERTFVLNYLSRYLLATRLVPALTLAPAGRLVLVANAGRYPDTLNFSDLQLRRAKPGLHVSGGTQFANDLLAVELADRLRHTRIRVSCVFPGLVRTNVFRNARGVPALVRLAAALLQPLVAMSPERAARTPVRLAQEPHTNGTDGHFFGPHCEHLAVPPRAKDRERRSLLWGVSRALVREFVPEPAHPVDREAIFVLHR